jgi:predicted Fe-Mo cluster-binding NifX family protein
VFLPNLEVISIETLLGENKDVATIWRGPLKIGVIRQFISDIEWNDLDFLVIDSPPGTGDEPLTVAQTIPDAKALIVTTPQEISLADVRKSIHFCRQVRMEILGIVENMSGLTCPHCGQVIELFKVHGGMMTAKQENLRFLGSLPLEPSVVQQGDVGSLAFLDDQTLPFTKALWTLAEGVESSMRHELPAKTESEVAAGAKMEKKSRAAGGKIIAVPVSDGKLASHFGHCERFAFLETANGEILNKAMHTPPPHEPGVIPRWLHEQDVDVIIAGGMGDHAQELLKEQGIEVVVGAPLDSPESLVRQYMANTLVTGANVCDH